MIHAYPCDDLRAKFAALQNGVTLLLHPGTYRVTPPEPIEIANQLCGGAALPLQGLEDVKILGSGNPMIQSTRHGSIIGIEDCARVSVSGLTLRGNGYITSPQPWYFALLYLGGNNHTLRVHDCEFSDSGDHGIGHLLDGETEHSVFERCYFAGCGMLVHSNLIADGAALAIGGSHNTYSDLLIEDCVRGIEWENKYGDFAKGGHETRGNIARGCRIFRPIWQAIYVDPSHCKPELFADNSIVDCIIQGRGKPFNDRFTGEQGIRLGGGTNWRISGCQISNLNDECGIAAELRCDLTDGIIEGNRIYGCGRNGIDLNQTAGQSIRRVMVRGNMIGPVGGRGIFLDGQNLRCTQNDVRETGPAGARWEGVYKKDGAKASIVTDGNWLTDTKETEGMAV